MDRNTDRPVTDREELLTRYGFTVTDIENSKRWGWVAAYTTVVGQFAVIGIFLSISDYPFPAALRVFFTIVAILIAIVGRIYCQHSQNRLREHRKRNKKVKKLLGEKYRKTFGKPVSMDAKTKWPLEPIVWGAFAITVFLLWSDLVIGYICT